MMDNVFERLKQVKNLNENDKVIVQYIKEHLDEIPYLSSGELARQTYTSSTSIIRFIKKLNYTSYNDFKLHIVSDLKNMKSSTLSIMSHEEILSLVNKVSDIDVSIIQKTKDLLSIETLKNMMILMNKYKYIDIIANDANAALGEYASHLLWSVNKVTTVHQQSDKQLLVGFQIPQDHLVIIISKYGKNPHFINIVKMLKKREVKTIIMTSQMGKELSQYCDYCLYGIVEESLDKLRDSVFYISIKYLFDLLYAILFSQNYEQAIEFESLYKFVYEKQYQNKM